MTASNQIFLVMDAGSPLGRLHGASRAESFLQRRREAFTNPLVYTFWGNHGPSIMTMSSALAE
jgi:hypothetical protein